MEIRLGPLGFRFAAAFVAVAIAAIAVFSIAVLLADQGNVSHLAASDRNQTAATAAALAQSAYRSADGWARADLEPVTVYAEQSGVGIDLTDNTGANLLSVAAPRPLAPSHPETVEQPIRLDGAGIGTAAVSFPPAGRTKRTAISEMRC